MASDWRIADSPALDTIDPDGNPWPPRGQRIVRLERETDEPGRFEYWEFPVPKRVTDAEVLADPTAWV